ncbi:apolipoprotein N-acyltransferase [Massilia sp. KIM]|uniref:apolipoprotein N-acyltransferase n=1 Tax=Massilia sp. KIM TaxID=1955422 RepID=UPI00098F28CA|nr:apolipoprotein N-acyltransferase [Massilia sp. KIM]OON60672.1 apolipoprotein N-acyltransferase [Massilia sp. KIM]
MLRRRSTTAGAPVSDARGDKPSLLLLAGAVLAGLSSLLSFQPVGWWPLQFLALAWLFYQVGKQTSVRRATLIGWAFGFGWSVAGMHWLYVFMTRFAHLPMALATVGVILLGLYMGLYGAFTAGVAAWLRKRWSLPVAAFVLLVLPVTWGVSEWLRGWVFTGFPWAASGYAHDGAPLAGYAPLIGVYGIGVLVALCAGCITMLTQRARWPAIGLLALVLGAGAGLRTVAWTEETGQPITVRLLQGNIPQDRKFDLAFLNQILAKYQGMITSAPADLIATPETAIPVFPHQMPEGYLEGLQRFSSASGSTLAIGMPLLDGPRQYANSVVALSPQPQAYRYDKAHLVPFGEFIPPGFRWFTDMLNLPLNDATRGKPLQAPFAVKDQLVLPNICYEDVFGEEIAYQLRSAARPATLLLNVSNLSWYGQSVAIPQHLQISRMRTLETGRPMLRSTNDGATAVIDHRGVVRQLLPFYQEGVLTATVRGTTGMTPYVRFGNALFLILGAVALGAAWFAGRRYRGKTGA